jgi:hypothetical protein
MNMKMKQLGLGIVLAMLCGVGIANELGDKVNAMTESGRRTFTGLIVRQTGAQCPTVQRTFFQGTKDKSAVWNITCNSRDSYALVFDDDAANSTHIMKCSEVTALVGVACFKKF